MALHRIFRYKVEVSFSDEEEPGPIQDRISQLLQETIWEETEKLLERYIPHNQTIQLDHLEVDLGSFSIDELEQEFTQRYVQRFVEALLAKIELKPANSSYSEKTTSNSSELERLEIFLKSGSFPWWKGKTSSETPGSLFRTLSASQQPGLIALLRHLGKQAYIRKRKALSFLDEELHLLIKLIEPASFPFILQYEAEVRKQHQHEPLVPLGPTAFRNTHWTLILKYLYEDRGSVFNQQSFVRQTLHDLASETGIEYHQLIRYFAQIAKETEARTSFKHQFGRILQQEYVTSLRKRPTPSFSEGAVIGSKKLSLLDQRLLEALLEGRGELPSLSEMGESHWQQLVLAVHKLDRMAIGSIVERLSYFGAKGQAYLGSLPPDLLVSLWEEKYPESAANWSDLSQFLRNVGEQSSNQEDYLLSIKRKTALEQLLDNRSSWYGNVHEWRLIIQHFADQRKLSLDDWVAQFLNTWNQTQNNSFRLKPLKVIIEEIGRQENLQYETEEEKWVTQAEANDVLKTGVKGLEEQPIYDPENHSIEEFIHLLHQWLRSGNYSLSNPALFWRTALHWLPHFLQKSLDSDQERLLNLRWRSLSGFYKLWEGEFITVISALGPGLSQSSLSSSDAKLLIWQALLELGPSNITAPSLVKNSLKALANKWKANFVQLFHAIQQELAAGRGAFSRPEKLYLLLKSIEQNDLFLSPFLDSNVDKASEEEVTELRNAIRQFESWETGNLPNGFPLERLLIWSQSGRESFRVWLGDQLQAATFHDTQAGQLPPELSVAWIDVWSPGVGQAIQGFESLLKETAFWDAYPQLSKGAFWKLVWREISFRQRQTLSPNQLILILSQILETQSSGGLSELLGTHRRAQEGSVSYPTFLQSWVKISLLPAAKIDSLSSQQLDIVLVLDQVNRNKGMMSEGILSDELSELLRSGLAIDRGSHSNQKAYLKQLLSQWANARGLIYNDLIETLHRLVGELAPGFRDRESLGIFRSVIVEELGEEFVLSLPSKPLSAQTTKSGSPLPKESTSKRKLWDTDPEEPNYTDTWIVPNAGLVLLWPYLNTLFERAGLMEDGAFIDEAARHKAVYLSDYLVRGENHRREYDLVLNKVLCSQAMELPLETELEITESLTELCEGLLQAVIGYWSILGETSISSFRETFLMREGSLKRSEKGWHLEVIEESYDILLSQLPWGISTVNLSWMDEVVLVEWG